MNGTAPPYPFADRVLSRRLERSEGLAAAAFVASRARLDPASGATWEEVEGAIVLFDGVDSPMTQTFGVGICGEPGTAALDRLERFFRDRGAPVDHEVSPMADPALLALLGERGYRPIELTSLLFRPLGPGSEIARPGGGPITVRRIDEDEADRWAEVAAVGWGETPEVVEFVRGIGRVAARAEGNHCFLAVLDGRPVAAASLSVRDGVALLAGASTIPEARGRGAQLALLGERLRFAADRGCDLAMMGAAPGSPSQRNAERQGFRIAYTRIKWRLAGR